MKNATKTIKPYLMFDGTCAPAMKFYEKAFGGELRMFPYSEAPVPEFKNVKDRIMHASLVKNGADILYAADNKPSDSAKRGDNVHMYFGCETEKEAEKIFAALGERGNVTMPLEKTFWSPRFGTLVDQFGILWMIGVDAPH